MTQTILQIVPSYPHTSDESNDDFTWICVEPEVSLIAKVKRKKSPSVK